MLTFFITAEERRRAQDRAAELDIDKSDQPGRPPFVWDNRQNCVKRWYDYASAEDKIGTIHFESSLSRADRLSSITECTVKLAYHPALQDREPFPVTITDPNEETGLIDFFFSELLRKASSPQGR